MEQLNEFDWQNMFDDLEFPRDGFQDLLQQIPSSSSPSEEAATEAIEPWIEELLMKNDDEDNNQQPVKACASDDLFMWSELLLNSPLEDHQPSDEPDVFELDVSPSLFPPPLFDDTSSSSVSNANSEGNVNTPTAKFDDSAINGGYIPNFESNCEIAKSGDEFLECNDTDADADPLSKKRKRQLRNRDAAMRSRERKKMYVKDLEMKSRCMEAECRRLGRLLQCCYAENQMLRISLGSAYGASLAKPESAVLLLESLLLVSLVWLMVNMCLLPLPGMPLLNQGAVSHESVERKEQESATPNRKGAKVTELWMTLSFIRSKRCRASKIKMKLDFDCAVLCI